MDFYITAIILGLCLSAMGLGIFTTMKIFNIPDITTDGSFTLGAIVTAVLLAKGVSIFIILPVVIVCGALAGTATALLHTQLKVNALLAGILVMTALYSVNLLIAGRSNIPLIDTANIFQVTLVKSNPLLNQLAIAFIIVILLFLLLSWLLKTDFGIAMRATGNNPQMVRALGINDNKMKLYGLAIANALTAFSGFLITQNFGYGDINMGVGIVITGLGSVLIADSLRSLFKVNNMAAQVGFVILGCVVFKLVLAGVIQIIGRPELLQLATAFFVLLIVALTKLFNKSKA